MNDRRWSDNGALRWVFAAAFGVACVAMATYVTVTTRMTYQMRYEITILTSELRREIAKAETEHANIARRIDMLEGTVFVSVVPDLADKRRPITSAEVWQRNWYANHERRITALERWRMLGTR